MYELIGSAHYLLATVAVLMTAAIIVAMLSFGTMRMYWLGTLITFVALITAYVTVLAITHTLSAWTLSITAGGGLVLSTIRYSRGGRSLSELWNRHRMTLQRLWMIVRGSWMLSVLSAVLLFVSSWFIFLAFLLPPTSYDSLWYHLPPVVGWLQQGHFVTIDHLRPNYPKNVEILVLWNTIFTHNQTFMNFTQLFFLPIGFVSVYTTAREIELSPENALIAGFVFLFTPIVLSQSVTTYVDLGVAALALASIASLMHFLNEPDKHTLLIFGASTGLLLGSKTSGLVFAGVFFLGFVYALYKTRGFDPYGLSVGVSIVGLLLLLLGGYWYLRNIVMFGNPIYPLAVDVAGVDILNGPVPTSERQNPWSGRVVNLHGPPADVSFGERMYLSWFERVPSYRFAPRIGGFGPQWAVLAIPSIVTFVYFSIRRQIHSHMFLFALFALPLVVLPAYKTRFTIYLVGIGAVAIGFVCERIVQNDTNLRRLIVIVLILSAGLSTGVRPTKYPGFVDQSLSDFDKRSSMIVSPHTMTPVEYENMIEHVPPGSRVGVRLQAPDLAFNLYYKNLENRLIYTRGTESPDELRSVIERNNMSHLIVYNESQQAAWALNMTTTDRVFENDRYYIFEVES